MKVGSNAAPIRPDTGKRAFASIAADELQMRIAASGMSEWLARLAGELCLEEVSVEEAFARIEESAIEKMVHMLDSSILSDEVALKCCMETVTRESERMAWEALEKGTEELRDGLVRLEEIWKSDNSGYVN